MQDLTRVINAIQRSNVLADKAMICRAVQNLYRDEYRIEAVEAVKKKINTETGEKFVKPKKAVKKKKVVKKIKKKNN